MRPFLDDCSLPVRPEILSLFEREWSRLANPGSHLDGAQRVEIASAARGAREGTSVGDGSLPSSATNVAAVLGPDPAGANRSMAESAVADLGLGAYVELVGVVSRAAAIDTFHHAVDAALPALPQPIAGDPTGIIDPVARRGPAWVPMVGGSSIRGALSAVPPEAEAQADMGGSLYMTHEQMADLHFVRILSRTQIELVASRTSALNECFY